MTTPEFSVCDLSIENNVFFVNLKQLLDGGGRSRMLRAEVIFYREPIRRKHLSADAYTLPLFLNGPWIILCRRFLPPVESNTSWEFYMLALSVLLDLFIRIISPVLIMVGFCAGRSVVRQKLEEKMKRIKKAMRPVSVLKVLLCSAFHMTSSKLGKPKTMLKQLYGQIGQFLLFVPVHNRMSMSQVFVVSFKTGLIYTGHLVFPKKNEAVAPIYKQLKTFDNSGNYWCPSCRRVVVGGGRSLQMCHACKRLGATRLMVENPEATLLSGFTIRFCGRRCLKQDWSQHKRLHALLNSLKIPGQK